MNKEEDMNIKEILEKHEKWVHGEEGGERANFHCADLRGADLYSADLRGADLRGADLYSADLSGAKLCYADLSGADLSGAKFMEIRTDIWTVQIHAETVRIGCQHHKHEEWMAFTDDEIAGMESRALKWWKIHKPVVQAGIAAVKAQGD